MNEQASRLPQPKVMAVAVIAALNLMPAQAMAQSDEAQKIQRVEITGSSIKRIDNETALPVQLIKREDIEKSGVTYQLTPMGTILEGDWEEVMGVVTDCFRALQGDCHRISMNMKVDYRAGSDSSLRSKIDADEGHVGHKSRT